MEIHPPHAPIRSFRGFLLELLTITAGVLIALSLEGLVEWNHYRVLVRDARETISREIADNKKEVDGELAGLGERKKNIDRSTPFTFVRRGGGRRGRSFSALRAASGQTGAADWKG